MSSADARRFLILLFVAAVATVSLDDLRTLKDLPRPCRMLYAAFVYSFLGFIGEFAPMLAVAFGVGYELQLVVKTVQAGQFVLPAAQTQAGPPPP